MDNKKPHFGKIRAKLRRRDAVQAMKRPAFFLGALMLATGLEMTVQYQDYLKHEKHQNKTMVQTAEILILEFKESIANAFSPDVTVPATSYWPSEIRPADTKVENDAKPTVFVDSPISPNGPQSTIRQLQTNRM